MAAILQFDLISEIRQSMGAYSKNMHDDDDDDKSKRPLNLT